MHILDEYILRLAELSEQMIPYNEEELAKLEHMKTCEVCYNKFCVALALTEMTSESGYITLANMYHIEDSIEIATTSLKENALAVIRVARKKVEQAVHVVLEQISPENAFFYFEPEIAFGTRDIEGKDSGTTIQKIADIENSKTFIAFDEKNNELQVRIHIKELENDEISIYLLTDSGTRIELDVIKKKNSIEGRIRDIPKEDFTIHIEEIL